MNNFNKKRAFTLAEILIAMFIFAMIATMLIPNVTNNAEKVLFVTQLKKVQNDIQQALIVILAENQGSFKTVCLDKSGAYSACFRDEIVGSDTDSKRRNGKLERHCSFDAKTTNSSIYSGKKELANPYKQKEAYKKRNPLLLNKQSAPVLSVNDKDSFVATTIKNGATMSVVFDPSCNTSANSNLNGLTPTVNVDTTSLCGYIEIDLNAGKAPNTVGKDIHYFWIVDREGLVPFGELDDLTCGSIASDGTLTLPTKTSANNSQYGCTYRLIYSKKGIDYY